MKLLDKIKKLFTRTSSNTTPKERAELFQGRGRWYRGVYDPKNNTNDTASNN